MSLRVLQTLLAGLVACFVVASAYISDVIVERQQSLRHSLRYDHSWTAAQAVSELSRLINQIAGFIIPGSGVEKDEVQLRFEIMLSRLETLRTGGIKEALQASPDQMAAVRELTEALTAAEPLIERIEQPGSPEKAFMLLAPLEKKLTSLASAVHHFGESRVANDHEQLIRLHFFGTAVAVSLIVCGMGLTLLFVWHNRLLVRAHRELKNVTAELKSARDDLEQTVAHRTADLRLALDAAEEANKAKSLFLASMSHELRTPLNAIIGYSEMLMEDADLHKNHEIVEDLRKIKASGRHLLALISSILDLSKIEAGRMELNCERFAVLPLVNEAVETCRPIAQKNKNELAVSVGKGVGFMSGDQTKLRQCLLNLLSNACKFTKDGTVFVRVEAEAGPTGTWMRFIVKDSGIGISPEDLPRLFSNFSQASSATSTKYGGTGLGLALSQKLCKLMGGHIAVESTLGRGSCFTICLPVSGQPAGSDMDPDEQDGSKEISRPDDAVAA